MELTKGFSIGVGGRIFGALALNGIVAFTIGVGAYLVLGSLHADITDVTARQFPAVVASAKLERQHQRIMRALEELASSKDNLTRAALNQGIADLFAGYDRLLAEVDQEDGRIALRTATLEDLRNEIVRIRQSIDGLVETRIDAGNAVRDRDRSLQLVSDALVRLDPQEEPNALVQRWMASAQRALYLLVSAHRVENPYALTRLSGEAGREMTTLDRLSETLPAEAAATLRPLADALRPIASGDASIFHFRRVQLDAEERLNGLVDRANQVSLTNTGLNTAIFVEKTALAEQRRQDIISASVNYTRLFFSSVGVVLISGMLSFVYIRRKVVERLWQTRQALRDKAEGGDGDIPVEGSDEITELARALRFYIHETEVKGEELRKNERWLRAVLEATPVPLVISGLRDGQIRFVNRRASDLFGASDGDRLVGRAVPVLWSEPAAHDRFVATIRARETASDLEAELVTDDGRSFWGLLSGLSFEFQGEAVLLMSVVDITRRREAEELLRRTQAFLDAVIDNVPSALFVLDGASGRVVVWNHAAERAFSAPAERIRGRTLTGALGEVTGRSLWPGDPAAGVGDVEEVVVGEGGDRRILALQRHPFGWSDDGRDHVICIGNDVTASHQAQEELRHAKERAERADAAKTEFLATVSHEMRTPLNGILGLARLLVTGSLGPGDRRHALAIMQCGMTLLDHVNDILDLRKIEDNKLDVDPQPCVLRPLLDEVLVTVESLVDEKALTLSLTVAEDVPPALVIDQHRLRQILINLLGNAVKFTERGGIEVAVARAVTLAGDRLRLSVRDSGIGIPAHRLDAVFDKLEQADASIARRFGGSGLGLAIVRHVVEAMDGTVTVESTVGVGSIFTVDVALVPAPADTQPYAAAGRRIQPLERSLRLLLVEDSPINQEIAISVLGDAGHRIALAENGQRAFELATTGDFDAILLDIRLPDLDGDEVARRIRRLPDAARASVPIIALTANVFVGAQARYSDAGIDAIVEKPLFPERLIQVLSNVLASRRARNGYRADAPADVVASNAPIQETEVSEADIVDTALLDRYVASLGERRFAAIRKALVDTVASKLPRLSAADATDEELSETAHLLAGAASHFGLNRFVAAMRRLEDLATAGRRDEAAGLIAAAPALFAAALEVMDGWCAQGIATTDTTAAFGGVVADVAGGAPGRYAQDRQRHAERP